MEHLWAPWRVELFRQPKRDGCFFCEYLQQDQDETNLILERGPHCFVIMNRYPYNDGHLMIVPCQHTGNLGAMSAESRAAMWDYCIRWQKIITGSLKAQGFNLGMNLGKTAGAGVDDHVHLHIVPRWLGDVNFMPILADTKVVNQALTELYKQLRAAASEL